MDSAVIEDLKQFIEVTVSRSLKLELEPLEQRINTKIDAMGSYIAEAIDGHNDDNQQQFKDYDRRIRRLEGRSIEI